MRQKAFLRVIFMLLVASMLLVACQAEAPTPSEEPAAEEPAVSTVAEEPAAKNQRLKNQRLKNPLEFLIENFCGRSHYVRQLPPPLIVKSSLTVSLKVAIFLLIIWYLLVILMPQNLSWINTEPVTWIWPLSL